MFHNAAIIGVGQSAYTRRPEPGQSVLTFIADATVAALKDAGLSAGDVQGMAVASFSLAPDAAVDLAWKLGLSLRWLNQDTNGGSSAMNMLGNALRTVEAGAADVILILAGDATGLAGYAKVAANFNTVTQKHLAPLGHGGPNGVYALVTSRQMKKIRAGEVRLRRDCAGAASMGGNEPVRGLSHGDDDGGVPGGADGGRSLVPLRLRAGGGRGAGDHRGAARSRARRVAPASACAPIAPASTTTTRRATAWPPASVRSPKNCGTRPRCVRKISTSRRSTTIIRPWCWAQANDLGLVLGHDLARFLPGHHRRAQFSCEHFGRNAVGRPARRPRRRLERHFGGGAAIAAPRRRAPGQGRSARRRDRLRHDHVSATAARQPQRCWSAWSERGPDHLALPRLSAPDFFQSGFFARAATATSSRPTVLITG